MEIKFYTFFLLNPCNEHHYMHVCIRVKRVREIIFTTKRYFLDYKNAYVNLFTQIFVEKK